MKIKQLYEDFNVDYAEGGHKNVRDGWVGVHCPFCPGKQEYHLGYNVDDDYFSCWRCGPHPHKQALIKILNVDEKTANELLKQYQGDSVVEHVPIQRDPQPFKLPSGCGPLLRMHEQYLASRGFDPDRLESEWGLLGTGGLSRLGPYDYRFRVIAPIRWNGNTVSFQGRAISDKIFAKYKTCPPEYEKIHHKHILYGKQEAWKRTGIVVEGITDVWRIGPRAVATFGIKFTREQVRVIAKAFERTFILFDPEPQARWMAKTLKNELNYYSHHTSEVYNELKQDPGSLTQDEADYLIKQLTS